VVVGVLALLGDKPAKAAAAVGEVWVAYPLSGAPYRWAALGGWIVLALAGLAVQLRGKAKKAAKAKKKAKG